MFISFPSRSTIIHTTCSGSLVIKLPSVGLGLGFTVRITAGLFRGSSMQPLAYSPAISRCIYTHTHVSPLVSSKDTYSHRPSIFPNSCLPSRPSQGDYVVAQNNMCFGCFTASATGSSALGSTHLWSAWCVERSTAKLSLHRKAPDFKALFSCSAECGTPF